MKDGGGFYNRAARRSGGSRKFVVTGKPQGQILGLLCYYGKHVGCEAKNDKGKCECKCHE